MFDGMSDGQEPVFTRVLNVSIPFETYQDPEKELEHRTREALAVSGLHICANLFWAIQRLAYHADNRSLAFNLSDYFETAQTIGQLGRAVALGVSEHVETLERLAAQTEGAK
jgi:hypothetical protein